MAKGKKSRRLPSFTQNIVNMAAEPEPFTPEVSIQVNNQPDQELLDRIEAIREREVREGAAITSLRRGRSSYLAEIQMSERRIEKARNEVTGNQQAMARQTKELAEIEAALRLLGVTDFDDES